MAGALFGALDSSSSINNSAFISGYSLKIFTKHGSVFLHIPPAHTNVETDPKPTASISNFASVIINAHFMRHNSTRRSSSVVGNEKEHLQRGCSFGFGFGFGFEFGCS
jgi:hypothetical protein